MNQLEPKVPLDVLDPERDDPGYWDRFQARVLEAVAPVLAERRRERITVGDVMLSWSRLVLPLAAAAAALGVLIPRVALQDEVVAVAGVEDVIGVPADGGEPLPAFLHSDEDVDRDVVLFAVQDF